MKTRFVWDEAKNLGNVRKHGISFNEAARVFLDPLRQIRQDRIEHGEVRWQTVGRIGEYRIILVAHTSWDDEDTEIIRIISARRVTPIERRKYEIEDG